MKAIVIETLNRAEDGVRGAIDVLVCGHELTMIVPYHAQHTFETRDTLPRGHTLAHT